MQCTGSEQNMGCFVEEREDAAANAVGRIESNDRKRSISNGTTSCLFDVNAAKLEGQNTSPLEGLAPSPECCVASLPSNLAINVHPEKTKAQERAHFLWIFAEVSRLREVGRFFPQTIKKIDSNLASAC